MPAGASCRMSIGGSACSPSHDPRKAGKCYRCDRPLPPKPEPIHRSLDLERAATEEAARGACDPTQLIGHAEVRALKLSGEYVPDFMLIRPGRDRLLDAREEAADARNHLVFWLQENNDFEDERRDDVMIALRFFALAYDRLTQEER